MSERSGGRDRSELSGVSEQVSEASERANGRASGKVLQSVFLVVQAHSAMSATAAEALVWGQNREQVICFMGSPLLSWYNGEMRNKS